MSFKKCKMLRRSNKIHGLFYIDDLGIESFSQTVSRVERSHELP